MKMIIKKEVVEEVEIEIELPFFSREGNKYHALIKDKIVVVYDIPEPLITTYLLSDNVGIAAASRGERITEYEFMAAYEKASKTIADFLQPETVEA